jgi:hypothetical protein
MPGEIEATLSGCSYSVASIGGGVASIGGGPLSFVEVEGIAMIETDDLERFRKGFRRSRKNNLWQLFEGQLLTVFRRHGRYVFYMAEQWTPDGPIPPGVSEETYATEDNAIQALAEVLGVAQQLRSTSPDPLAGDGPHPRQTHPCCKDEGFRCCSRN